MFWPMDSCYMPGRYPCCIGCPYCLAFLPNCCMFFQIATCYWWLATFHTAVGQTVADYFIVAAEEAIGLGIAPGFVLCLAFQRCWA